MPKLWGEESKPKPQYGGASPPPPARRGRIIGGGSRKGPRVPVNYTAPARKPKRGEDAFCGICGAPFATKAGHICKRGETLGKPRSRIGPMTAEAGSQPARGGRSGALPGRGRQSPAKRTSRVAKQRGVKNTALGQGQGRWRPSPDPKKWKPFWGRPPKDSPDGDGK